MGTRRHCGASQQDVRTPVPRNCPGHAGLHATQPGKAPEPDVLPAAVDIHRKFTVRGLEGQALGLQDILLRGPSSPGRDIPRVLLLGLWSPCTLPSSHACPFQPSTELGPVWVRRWPTHRQERSNADGSQETFIFQRSLDQPACDPPKLFQLRSWKEEAHREGDPIPSSAFGFGSTACCP